MPNVFQYAHNKFVQKRVSPVGGTVNRLRNKKSLKSRNVAKSLDASTYGKLYKTLPGAKGMSPENIVKIYKHSERIKDNVMSDLKS